MIHSSRACIAMLLLTCMLSAIAFTPAVARFYGTAHYNPLPDLSEEIAYIHKHYRQPRFLTAYDLGGYLIFLTRGTLPVFIDGRAGTAYPDDVVDSYIAFHDRDQGWSDIFDRYHLDGAIIPSAYSGSIDQFSNRKGWHLAFTGKMAMIFVRDKK